MSSRDDMMNIYLCCTCVLLGVQVVLCAQYRHVRPSNVTDGNGAARGSINQGCPDLTANHSLVLRFPPLETRRLIRQLNLILPTKNQTGRDNDVLRLSVDNLELCRRMSTKYSIDSDHVVLSLPTEWQEDWHRNPLHIGIQAVGQVLNSETATSLEGTDKLELNMVYSGEFTLKDLILHGNATEKLFTPLKWRVYSIIGSVETPRRNPGAYVE